MIMVVPLDCQLISEKALGECGDKTHLDGQPDNSLERRHYGDWIIQNNSPWEKTSTMKRGEAKNKSPQRGKARVYLLSQKIICCGEEDNDAEVSDGTPRWLIPVSSEKIEQDGKDIGSCLSLQV